jgi:hypothetical protein
MVPVAAPPAPITAPLAVLLQPFFFVGCRGGGSIIFRLIHYYSFPSGFLPLSFLPAWIDHFCFSIATSMESTVAVFAASKSIFP